MAASSLAGEYVHPRSGRVSPHLPTLPLNISKDETCEQDIDSADDTRENKILEEIGDTSVSDEILSIGEAPLSNPLPQVKYRSSEVEFQDGNKTESDADKKESPTALYPLNECQINACGNIIYGEIEYLSSEVQESPSYKTILSEFYHTVTDSDAVGMEKIVCRYDLDVNVIFTGSLDFVTSKHRGWCAIHIAASHGDLKLIQYLLSEGSDVEAVTPNGETPLHIAAKYGAADVVALLLECNVFLRDRQNNQGATALLKAIVSSQHAYKGNYRRCVQLLLGSGCNPNISSSLRVTALHLAVDKGDPLLVSRLVEAGANINALCDNKTSPLLRALISKHVNNQVIKTLLCAGADTRLTMNGRCLLHMAIVKCDDIVVELFLSSGADPNLQDNSGNTPLWVAVEENRVRIVPLIVRAGGNINYVRQPQCVSLLSHAIMLNSLQMVKVLLQEGASTYTETVMWSTPLHIAVDVQNIDIIIELLRVNCALNTTSNAKYAYRPMTPVRLAMEFGNLEIIDLLMKTGCRVNRAWLKEYRLPQALSLKPEAVEHIRKNLVDVPSLLHLCRLKIRENMADGFTKGVKDLTEKLVIPQKISNYLMMKDILE